MSTPRFDRSGAGTIPVDGRGTATDHRSAAYGCNCGVALLRAPAIEGQEIFNFNDRSLTEVQWSARQADRSFGNGDRYARPMSGSEFNEFGQPIGLPVPGWQPARMPQSVTLTGMSIHVVPLAESHLPGLYAACCRPEDDARWTYIPSGPFRSIAALADDLAARRAAGFLPFALVDPATQQPRGMASLLRIEPAIGTIEVGYIVYSPSLARTRAATEAMYLLARHVFEDLGFRRYEWKCDSLNAASCAAAVRLGFTAEGIWRNATIAKGRNRDTAWFAMTDGDWRRLRPAYEQWFASSTDTGQGVALSRLTAAALAPEGPRDGSLG